MSDMAECIDVFLRHLDHCEQCAVGHDGMCATGKQLEAVAMFPAAPAEEEPHE